MRQILHVDMDAFYASVEQRDTPALKGKPVVVGGGSHRGVVAAASYEVRKFGVRSAMPMAEALRKCPQAIVVPPRMKRYAEVSAAVFEIFHRYTPLVEGLSLDEAFLDVTGSCSLFGDAITIAGRIKSDIKGELSLTASAGVATSKFVAKIASDLKKPDGLVVAPEDVAAFLAELPIERMWGVGEATAPKLHALGFRTFRDLARADPSQLQRTLGAFGLQIGALARGEDVREVDPSRDRKSVGAEETYESDLWNRDAILQTLLAHSERVAGVLYDESLSARIVTVKLKYADFSSVTRRTTLPEPVTDTTSIYDAARALLAEFPNVRQGVRLTGVSVSALEEASSQRLLFVDPKTEKWEAVERAVRAMPAKLGLPQVTRASLLHREKNVGGVSSTRRKGGDGGQ